MRVQVIVDGIDSLLLANEHDFVQYVVDVACAQKAQSVEELIAIACAAGRSPRVNTTELLQYLADIAKDRGNVGLEHWANGAMVRGGKP